MSEAKSQAPISGKLEDENEYRESWIIGSKCLVYSDVASEWILGEIIEIFIDDEGEWLNVKYIKNKEIFSKQIQRYCTLIKPIFCDKNLLKQRQKLIETKKNIIIDSLFDIFNGKDINKLIKRNDDKINAQNKFKLESKQRADNEEKENADILTIIRRGKGNLFDKKRSDFDGKSVERIKFILLMYNIWIANHENNNNENISFDEIIENELDSQYKTSEFLIDYRIVTEIKKDLFENENNAKNICNANLCKIIDRNSRNRVFYGVNNHKLMDLYYQNNNNNNKESLCNISTQQILDSLHTYIYHTMYINLDDLKETETETESDEFNSICDDLYVTKLCKLIETKKNQSNRFTKKLRGEEQNEYNYNKFQSTNMNKYGLKTFMQITQNKKQQCFLDILMIELKKNNIQKRQIKAIDKYIFDEQYDSVSIMQDLADKNQTNSNFIYFLKVCRKFVEISNRLIIEDNIRTTLYSPGRRYFYWEYYKNNQNEKRVVYTSWNRPVYEENIGYKLCDWFIAKKYANLKEELTHNLISTFSIQQFEITFIKTRQKLDAWIKDPNVANIKCEYDCWKEPYGIKRNDEISFEHILCILFYCNFSAQCFSFGETFRKLHKYESDQDMKKRHREFAIWGRLIRETVEVFGTAMKYSNIKWFYHGVSDTLIFDSTSVKLCGPVSTTGDFQIAIGIFGADGIVVDFIGSIGFLPYFNCRSWSDFHSEDEKLFVGGLQHFTFNTIRNMQPTPKQNYGFYVRALTMFHYMIEAWPWKGGKIKSQYCNALKLMINEEISENILKKLASTTPTYILKLWHHFLWKIKNVEINWSHLNKDIVDKRNNQYGFKAFSSLFTTSNCESLNFDIFLKILPNVERIDLNYYGYGGWQASIELNELFLSNILSSIQFINKRASLRSSFKSFNIYNPNSKIIHFINTNNDKFIKYGWKLSKTKCKSIFHRSYPQCYDTLTIQRL